MTQGHLFSLPNNITLLRALDLAKIRLVDLVILGQPYQGLSQASIG
jgi:uracil DNA glycosylase